MENLKVVMQRRMCLVSEKFGKNTCLTSSIATFGTALACSGWRMTL